MFVSALVYLEGYGVDIECVALKCMVGKQPCLEWLSKGEITAFFVVVFVVHEVAFAEKFSPDAPCFVRRVFLFRPEVWSGHG